MSGGKDFLQFGGGLTDLRVRFDGNHGSAISDSVLSMILSFYLISGSSFQKKQSTTEVGYNYALPAGYYHSDYSVRLLIMYFL